MVEARWRAVALALPVAVLAACGGGSTPTTSGPTTSGPTTGAPTTSAPTASAPTTSTAGATTGSASASGQSVSLMTQGYAYSVEAVSGVGTTVQVDSPYLVSAASAPAGQEMATVTISLTNAMADRAVPLQIATSGDIDFSFAVPSEDSAGLSESEWWQGDCTVMPAPTTAARGLCVDLATRVQSTDPDHVDELEPEIPAGGTVTMHLYSSPFPTSLSLTSLELIYSDPIDGTQTLIPLPH